MIATEKNPKKNPKNPMGHTRGVPFPIECTEMVVLFLPPLDRFTIATYLRLLYIQTQTIPVVPELCELAACRKGYVDLLEKWKSIASPQQDKQDGIARRLGMIPNNFEYFSLMDTASWAGHVHVLEWLHANYERISWTDDAMDYAASPTILEWWKNSQLRLIYTRQAMDTATRTGRVDLLQWWLESGLELRYSRYSRLLIYHKKDQVREWWRNSGLALECNNTHGVFVKRTATRIGHAQTHLLTDTK